MGLLDSLVSGVLKGALERGDTNALGGLLAQVLGKTDLGGVGGLLAQLQQGGLGSQVSSWLSNGQNIPVSADQLRNAIGSDRVQQITEASGLPIDKLLAALSQHLPQTIDKMSPNGTLEEDASLADQAGASDVRV